MGTSKRRRAEDGLRPEYDFSAGVRGKYAGRVRGVRGVVVLDPDVARVFKTAEAVNSALRSQMGKGRGPKAPGGGSRRSRRVRTP